MPSPTASRRDNDHGFTLIELLVVLIIIGILSAIAVPVYMVVKDKARMSSTTQSARNIIPEVITARDNIQGSLETVTGSGWSAGPCFSATVLLVKDPGFNASPCGQEWNSMTQRLATASGSPVGTIRKILTDGWGRPMVFDENEGEMNWTTGTRNCNSPDYVFSTGGHGTFVGPGGKTLRWEIPLGAFCG